MAADHTSGGCACHPVTAHHVAGSATHCSTFQAAFGARGLREEREGTYKGDGKKSGFHGLLLSLKTGQP
jgi:hypothetical protein